MIKESLSSNENKFLKEIKDKARIFKEIKAQRVRVISHLDADGISSAAILLKMLNRENILYNLSIVQKISNKVLKAAEKDNSNVIIFSDLGSADLNKISNLAKKKDAIFILDHHDPQTFKNTPSNLHFINPHLFNIDGNSEISGSGVSYLFAKAINPKNIDLSYLAIIGAIGDIQEDNGFKGLNNRILSEAINSKTLEVKPGLRLYGYNTRPLYKLLEYSTDPYLPGITGSESGAIQFLQNLNIPIKKKGSWIKFNDLNNEEKKKLISALIMLLSSTKKDPEKIIGNIYEVSNEERNSQLKDAKEFATFLNACGRLGKASIGIGVCLNNQKLKQQVSSIINQYKKEIIRMLRWFEINENNPDYVIKNKGFIIINGKEFIKHTMIGTFASMITKSKVLPKNTIILAFAHIPEENLIKASIRSNNENFNLKEIIQRICERIPNCEYGGHKNAAGAFFPIEKEKEIIKISKEVLNLASIEEKIQ